MSIHVRLLGTAAGGGLPQWNCCCDNCQAAREGRIARRTQSSVAISADGRNWFLVNASPDLRAQIEATPQLQPVARSLRNSPIAGVLLTNADLDHVLGLVLLREGESISVNATEAVRETLTDALGFDVLLGGFCGVQWKDAGREFSPLGLRDGLASGLSVRAIYLPGLPPRFVKSAKFHDGHSIAWQVIDDRGARLLIAPDVAEITAELRQAIEEAEVVLFDGTFWSTDELRRIDPQARLAHEMGHLPIRDGSLPVLAKSPARRKIFLHINNSNPILMEGSAEHAAVTSAGLVVGEDGMEFEI